MSWSVEWRFIQPLDAFFHAPHPQAQAHDDDDGNTPDNHGFTTAEKEAFNGVYLE